MVRFLIATQLLLAGVWSGGMPTVRAAEPAPSDDSVFEGQWSLDFSLSTPPGGATYAVFGVTASPHNIAFQATRSDFAVNKDGTFSCEEHEHGLYHSDVTLIDKLGQHSYPAQTQQPILKARGQVAKETRTLSCTWTGAAATAGSPTGEAEEHCPPRRTGRRGPFQVQRVRLRFPCPTCNPSGICGRRGQSG